jgi:hypothetical protein
MNPRVTQVVANDDYTLTITFTNSEVKLFDVKPFLDRGIFTDLKDLRLFRKVNAAMGTVYWPAGQDFCPDTLYEIGRTILSE